jgi:cytochrome c peroxidase
MTHPRCSILPAVCAWLGSASALMAAPWLESPAPQLAITFPESLVSWVTVQGTPDIAYRLNFTDDFRIWSQSPAQTADAEGRVSFPVSAEARGRFFQAISTGEPSSFADPAEVTLGRRLFLETRFAQFFAAHCGSELNAPLSNGGDPALARTLTVNGALPGPFLGQSMNCRACHLGDEFGGTAPGMRTLADFAIRSAIPNRGDSRRTTVRNSPSLVNLSIHPTGRGLFHYDGEFPNVRSLVRGTLTGRNFGWLPEERTQAVQHIARVIREDDGRAFLGPEWGGSYPRLLAGTDPQIPPSLRLPAGLRLEVSRAPDEEILDRIALLVEIYLSSLRFSTDEVGSYNGSPYDLFLRKNSLPRRPEVGEDDLAYSRRLRGLVAKLTNPVFVTPADGAFSTLQQAYRFGAEELLGFKIFLAEPPPSPSVGQVSIGNCLVCHPAPHFTDLDFHNSGATQWEYDAIHGEGAFARVPIPGAVERAANPDKYLPASPGHPAANGPFLSIPTSGRPGDVDLGLWNVYANGDVPLVQEYLRTWSHGRFGSDDPVEILPRTVALFKTPGLRSLGGSAPYMHTGQASTLESVIFFYRFTAELGRIGELRNGDPEMGRVFLGKFDGAPLAAFLRSLNEDFP